MDGRTSFTDTWWCKRNRVSLVDGWMDGGQNTRAPHTISFRLVPRRKLKRYDFQSSRWTFQNALSSNQRTALGTRCVLIGRAGKRQGEIGKLRSLLLVFTGDIWRIRPKESHHQIRDKQTFPMVPDMIRKRPIMIANGVTQKVINIDLQGIKWPFSRQISTFLFDKWNKEMFLHTQDYCLRHLKLWKVSFCVLFVPSRSMQVQPSYSQLEGGGS